MDINEALTLIKQLGTNGDNHDVSNEDILNKIQTWNKMFGLEIFEVEADELLIQFNALPADTRQFAQEIYEFCPDIIDQHFGCFDEMLETLAKSGEELSEEMRALIDGVDFSSETYGLELLERTLKANHKIQLWWD